MALVLAMVLDAIFGEPKWLWDRVPHPAIVMGRVVAKLDAALNNKTRGAGVLAVVVLVGVGAFQCKQQGKCKQQGDNSNTQFLCWPLWVAWWPSRASGV